MKYNLILSTTQFTYVKDFGPVPEEEVKTMATSYRILRAIKEHIDAIDVNTDPNTKDYIYTGQRWQLITQCDICTRTANYLPCYIQLVHGTPKNYLDGLSFLQILENCLADFSGEDNDDKIEKFLDEQLTTSIQENPDLYNPSNEPYRYMPPEMQKRINRVWPTVFPNQRSKTMTTTIFYLALEQGASENPDYVAASWNLIRALQNCLHAGKVETEFDSENEIYTYNGTVYQIHTKEPPSSTLARGEYVPGYKASVSLNDYCPTTYRDIINNGHIDAVQILEACQEDFRRTYLDPNYKKSLDDMLKKAGGMYAELYKNKEYVEKQPPLVQKVIHEMYPDETQVSHEVEATKTKKLMKRESPSDDYLVRNLRVLLTQIAATTTEPLSETRYFTLQSTVNALGDTIHDFHPLSTKHDYIVRIETRNEFVLSHINEFLALATDKDIFERVKIFEARDSGSVFFNYYEVSRNDLKKPLTWIQEWIANKGYPNHEA
jgi:hypothetical protein